MKKRLFVIGCFAVLLGVVIAFALVVKPFSSQVNSELESISLPALIEITEAEPTLQSDTENKTCTVVFTDTDGTVLQTLTVQQGESAVPPTSPIHEGSLFSGWSKPLTNIRTDTMIQAMYQPTPNPTIAVETVFVSEAQDTVSVSLYVLNNPGFSSLMVDLRYPSALELETVDFSNEFGEYAVAAEPYSSPQTISIISPFQDIESSGVVATLTFSVDHVLLGDGQSPLKIEASCIQDNTFNSEFEDVVFMMMNGSITFIR